MNFNKEEYIKELSQHCNIENLKNRKNCFETGRLTRDEVLALLNVSYGTFYKIKKGGKFITPIKGVEKEMYDYYSIKEWITKVVHANNGQVFKWDAFFYV